MLAAKNRLSEHIKILVNLQTYFKKAVNTRLTRRNLFEKLDLANQTYKDIQTNLIIFEEGLTDPELIYFEKASRNAIYEIRQSIAQKLKHNKLRNKFKIITLVIIFTNRFRKLPKMALDIKTAAELATLIPTYGGEPKATKAFIDAINLTSSIVKTEQKDSTIQLILTKMTGKARDLFPTTPISFQEIIEKLKANCTDTTSSDMVLAKIKNLKTKKGDLQDFTKEVESLSQNLTQTYIREEINPEAAKRLSQKAIVQKLIDTATLSETKMMLKIGKFASVTEAINLVLENESNLESTQHNILQVNGSRQQNRFGQQRPTNQYVPRYYQNYTRNNFRNNNRYDNEPPHRYNNRQSQPQLQYRQYSQHQPRPQYNQPRQQYNQPTQFTRRPATNNNNRMYYANAHGDIETHQNANEIYNEQGQQSEANRLTDYQSINNNQMHNQHNFLGTP